jgi:hypothetical protein
MITRRAALTSRRHRTPRPSGLCRGPAVDSDELGVRLCAREFIHEYLNAFTKIAAEYRLNLFRLMREDPDVPGSVRADMMPFTDALPMLRIAAEMKTEMFRNPSRPWTHNMLVDIDAISAAVPYCTSCSPIEMPETCCAAPERTGATARFYRPCPSCRTS